MPEGNPMPGAGALADDLFRRESARITAALLRRFGPAAVDDVEDIVQEALLRACRLWPMHGVPDNPAGWLWRVAERLAIDRSRRTGRRPTEEVDHTFPDPATAVPDETLIADAELRLLFLCCDPSNPAETAIPLTLRLAGGLSTAEIAAALLLPEATAAQRISRGKARLRNVPHLADPSCEPGMIDDRLRAVMNVIYLMFNAGYGGGDTKDWIREELCIEATRLARLLADHRRTAGPAASALAALCLLMAARLPARRDDNGDLVPLDLQDRRLWDSALVADGMAWLARAARGAELTQWHCLAGIAACHSAARTWAVTDWPTIRNFYDMLLAHRDDPVMRLNRAVAIEMVDGPAAALDALPPADGMQGYWPWHAARGRFLRALERFEEAGAAMAEAIRLAPSPALRRHLVAQCPPTLTGKLR